MEDWIKIKAHLEEALREFNAYLNRVRSWVKHGRYHPARAYNNLERCAAHLLAARKLAPRRLKRRISALIEEVRPLLLEAGRLEEELRPYAKEREIVGRLAPSEERVEELLEKMRELKEEIEAIVKEVRP